MIVSLLASEMRAHHLVYRDRSLTTGRDIRAECDDACNQIIELAERIKSDRASATFQIASLALQHR